MVDREVELTAAAAPAPSSGRLLTRRRGAGRRGAGERRPSGTASGDRGRRTAHDHRTRATPGPAGWDELGNSDQTSGCSGDIGDPSLQAARHSPLHRGRRAVDRRATVGPRADQRAASVEQILDRAAATSDGMEPGSLATAFDTLTLALRHLRTAPQLTTTCTRRRPATDPRPLQRRQRRFRHELQVFPRGSTPWRAASATQASGELAPVVGGAGVGWHP